MFEVIRGGLSDTASTSSRRFTSAYVTDTRLMGVTVLYIHWFLPENISRQHLHQFFYFDAEELGLETYNSILCDTSPEAYIDIQQAENKLIGGLGGNKVPITEREARSLVQQYIQFNKDSNLSLPENIPEFNALLTPHIDLSEEEESLLMIKQCTKIRSSYEAINYFMMRCVGRDFSAAKFLAKNYIRTDLYPEHKSATLLRNSIKKAENEETGTHYSYKATNSDQEFSTFDTIESFMSESLIEYDEKFFILLSQITLDHLKVVTYERLSSFRISQEEAMMMLSQQEYMTLFTLTDEAKERRVEVSSTSTKLLQSSMMTEHPGGTLFMIFNENNDHVNKPIFRLSEDVRGIIYVLLTGQILLAAFSKTNLTLLEKDLISSPLNGDVTPLSKYQFSEPILNDFIDSGIPDFELFVELVSESEE